MDTIKFIDPRLTITIYDDELELEIEDMESSHKHVRVKIAHAQFVQALGRLSFVQCKSGELTHLDKAGKVMEHKPLEFPLPPEENGEYMDRKLVAKVEVNKHCPEGWTPDMGFNSQGSLFFRDGKHWARTTIRRWVEPKE